MTNETDITPGSMVVTSKGNHGRVVSVGTNVANVKIGYKIHEIELYNLTNVTKGTNFQVEYNLTDGTVHKTFVFIKYGTIIWDMFNPKSTENLLKIIEVSLAKKLNVQSLIIVKINIP